MQTKLPKESLYGVLSLVALFIPIILGYYFYQDIFGQSETASSSKQNSISESCDSDYSLGYEETTSSADLVYSGGCGSMSQSVSNTDSTNTQAKEKITSLKNINTIPAELLKTWQDEGRQLVIIDVRKSEEQKGGIIKGSLLLPYANGVLEEKYQEIPISGTIVMVSQDGGLYPDAGGFLVSKGICSSCRLRALEGGVEAWVEAGYSLEWI